jgi:branched-chain amino acid transport system ATP-binding protein
MAISGLVHLISGSITFEGRGINGIPPEEIPARGIVHIPEGRRIFPGLTVLENLRLGAYLRRSSHYIEKDMRMIWDMFPILKERSNQLAGTLSGGEQQMLAIGRGLMLNPKLLMLDEPSLGLAPKFVTLIFEVIKRINSSGVTVLLIEQNAHMALGIADRGYLLETGKIVLSDDAKSLSSDPRIKSAYLGG